MSFSITTFLSNIYIGFASRYSKLLRAGQSGIEYRNRPDRPWVPPTLLYNGYWAPPEGKAPGVWRWQCTSSSAEVKGRVELYLYSPSGPSWAVLGWTGIAYWTQNLLLTLMQIWISPIFIKFTKARSGFVSVRAALRSHFIFFLNCPSK